MNKDLYNKRIKFPEEMKEHLKSTFSSVQGADQNTEGYNRNQELQGQSSISYQQLKRIKNFFDTFQGRNVDAPFILNGENKMKDFVNSILSGARQSLSTSQQIRNNTGMQMDRNDVPDPNVNLNLSQDTANKSTIEKYDLQVTESLKRINNLLKKIM